MLSGEIACKLLILSICSVATSSLNETIQNDNSTSGADTNQGWTSQPDGRGTLDILWSCSVTSFLCSWSILCLNMPGPDETKWRVLWRKTVLTRLGFLCPEIISEIAFGQWLSARNSVKAFSEVSAGSRPPRRIGFISGCVRCSSTDSADAAQSQNRYFATKWTMKEAFFADMGGFVIHARDQELFPLDTKQLHYLVSNGYLDLPSWAITRLRIRTKSTAYYVLLPFARFSGS